MSGFQTSPFGNGVAVGSGGNVLETVSNHYGPRSTGDTKGRFNTSGAKNQLVLDIDGAIVDAEAFNLQPIRLPAGALIVGVYLDVSEAFDLGGTDPVIQIGTAGSEDTNGFEIDEAEAQAANTHIDLTSTLQGTWAAGLTAVTEIGIALDGTLPTADPTVGKARITIEYIKVADQ